MPPRKRSDVFNKQPVRVFAFHRTGPDARLAKIVDHGTMTRQQYVARRPKLEQSEVQTVCYIPAVASTNLYQYQDWNVPIEFDCACSVPDCHSAATRHELISINNEAREVLPLCDRHAEAAVEDTETSAFAAEIERHVHRLEDFSDHGMFSFHVTHSISAGGATITCHCANCAQAKALWVYLSAGGWENGEVRHTKRQGGEQHEVVFEYLREVEP